MYNILCRGGNELKEIYNKIKKNANEYEIIGTGSNRITYDVKNNLVMKIPKKENIEKGFNQSQKEYDIWNHAPEMIRKYLVPVYCLFEEAIVMEKVIPLVDDKSAKKVDVNEDVRLVIEYLVKNYGLEEYELSFAQNWGILDGTYVLLDYGR